MLRTYEAVLHKDRLEWVDEKPSVLQESKDIHVHVTILEEKAGIEEKMKPKGTLVDFFRDSPLFDLDIHLERDSDCGREVIF
jgi:hypothetical protein